MVQLDEFFGLIDKATASDEEKKRNEEDKTQKMVRRYKVKASTHPSSSGGYINVVQDILPSLERHSPPSCGFDSTL